jgi:hypothetical protein
MADLLRVASVKHLPPGDMLILETDGEDDVLANLTDAEAALIIRQFVKGLMNRVQYAATARETRNSAVW